MKLTANFSASEFDKGEPWPAGKDANRAELAAIAQRLRDLAGVPGVITSAYRSPERNQEVGGTETSQHMKAEAVDILFLLVPIRTLAERFLAAVRAGEFPPFGQVIFYADRGHVHFSLPRLGSRNGEVRWSHEVSGQRVYPFLANADVLPTLSTKQKAAGVAIPGVAVLAFLALGLAVWPSGRVA